MRLRLYKKQKKREEKLSKEVQVLKVRVRAVERKAAEAQTEDKRNFYVRWILQRTSFSATLTGVMYSFQKNICDDEAKQFPNETMFVWNEFLTRGIRNLLENTIWTIALVYGFFKQVKLSNYGRDFMLTLIAR